MASGAEGVGTPIRDFVRRYAADSPARFHMPGHKGRPVLGCEALDITEIDGADALYTADGIIAESENIASALFGSRTFYSAEGSSLCVRAMLYLALARAGASRTEASRLESSRAEAGRPLVIAGRNAHASFVTAAALLDFDVAWIQPRPDEPVYSCAVTADALRTALAAADRPPCAVYVTSPDYLGSMADIAAAADVCHAYGAPLLVDNAHGAYLRFLAPSLHPCDLGADMCCDSAHKTLPVLTGGAYLHVRHGADAFFAERAREAMGLFGSTSPSYLILQSLDACNPYLAGHRERLAAFLPHVQSLRERLAARGFAAASR